MSNVYSKLMTARKMFLESDIKKSGINPYAEFEYFELKDIVPVANRIFTDQGLLFIVDFPENRATGKLIDVEDGSTIEIGFQYKSIAEPAKLRMNEVQGVGSEISYYRRYLYLMILDIVECDTIDATAGKGDKEAPKKSGKKAEAKKPATTEERAEIKKALTTAPVEQTAIEMPAVQGPASEESVNELKTVCKQLISVSPDQQAFVQKAALMTKGFTDITQEKCDALIKGVKELIAHYGN